jgi:hypothetical protein
MKLPARIISQGGKNLHIVWENRQINPWDEIVDIEAFHNGYDDSVRICESIEDAIYCMDSGIYKKLICGQEKIGYFMCSGIVNHDRAIMYLDNYTVEELHPSTILEILSSGGECDIQICNLSIGCHEFEEDPFPFLVHDKVLIHKKENQNK